VLADLISLSNSNFSLAEITFLMGENTIVRNPIQLKKTYFKLGFIFYPVS
jgi:hypothetical protein